MQELFLWELFQDEKPALETEGVSLRLNKFIYLFIYALYKDSIFTWDYIISNDAIINE
jgi:hypothetical protein